MGVRRPFVVFSNVFTPISYLCPAETPEGQPCGIMNHLAMLGEIHEVKTLKFLPPVLR